MSGLHDWLALSLWKNIRRWRNSFHQIWNWRNSQYSLLGDKEAESYASSTSMFASMTTYKKKKKRNLHKHFFSPTSQHWTMSASVSNPLLGYASKSEPKRQTTLVVSVFHKTVLWNKWSINTRGRISQELYWSIPSRWLASIKGSVKHFT